MKNRIIIVPQFNTRMRYQEWWYKEFEIEFNKYFDEVIIIGKKILDNNIMIDNSFLSPKDSINFECEQIKEYMELELRDNDILFLLDLSFPGLFSNVLFHKRPKKIFAYCHATSLNYEDYFSKDQHIKWPIEYNTSLLFDGIFVGSNYHKRKIQLLTKTYVVNLPKPPFQKLCKNNNDNLIKKYDIISVARNTHQKINLDIENKVERDFGEITRKQFNNWDDYIKYIHESKILLISSREDTFNYSIIDAVENNCIPIAPNNLCFPEILPRKYLYDDYDELKEIINKVLNNEIKVPKLICQNNIDNFYKNVYEIMIR